MKKFTGVIVLLFVFGLIDVCGQVGPSVSAGIDKIAYSKGELDAELIVEIVSTKKEEIRRELAQRLILKNIECGSFTGWNFARRTIDLLLTERKEGVLKKEMLRNLTELAMVVGISEFYLESLRKKSQRNILTDNEKRFLLQYFRWTDIESKKHLDLFMPTVTGVYNGLLPADIPVTAMDVSDIGYYYQIIDLYQYVSRNQSDPVYLTHKSLFNPTTAIGTVSTLITGAEFNSTPSMLTVRTSPPAEKKARGYLPGTVLLASLRNRNAGESKERSKQQNPDLQCNCDLISPNHILLDMIYDICRNDEGVRDLDLFHTIGVPEESYLKNNKYFTMPPSARYGATKTQVEHLVHFLFKNSTALAKLVENASTYDWTNVRQYINGRMNQLVSRSIPLNRAEIPIMIDTLAENFRDQIEQVKADMEDINLKFVEVDETAEKGAESLSEIYSFLQRTFTNPNFDYVYYDIEHDLMQKIVELSAQVDKTNMPATIKNTLTHLASLRSTAEAGAMLDMWRDYDSLNIRTDFSKFVDLIDVINNYDKVEYYDMLIKFIGGLDKIYTENSAARIVSHLATGFDKYTILDGENNTLDFDVESMAVDLYDTYAKNNSWRVQPYFTVGVVYGIPNHERRFLQPAEIQNLDNSEIDQRVQNGELVRSINFVSEKIGAKWKIIDRNRQYSFGDEVKPKPFMTDIHLIAYGSGLLYQVKSLTTDNDFKKPLYGFGAGLTFFNGLDVNAGYSAFFNDGFSKGFFAFSFDIAFTEYLSSLKKKSKSR